MHGLDIAFLDGRCRGKPEGENEDGKRLDDHGVDWRKVGIVCVNLGKFLCLVFEGSTRSEQRLRSQRR